MKQVLFAALLALGLAFANSQASAVTLPAPKNPVDCRANVEGAGYQDLNSNGQWDIGESSVQAFAGLSGQQQNYYTIWDLAYRYRMEDVEPGWYRLTVFNDTLLGSVDVEIAGCENIPYVDVPMSEMSSCRQLVEGVVFEDRDRDQIYDLDDVALPGVVVNLTAWHSLYVVSDERGMVRITLPCEWYISYAETYRNGVFMKGERYVYVGQAPVGLVEIFLWGQGNIRQYAPMMVMGWRTTD